MGNWSTFIINSYGKVTDKIKFKNMRVEFNRGHLVFHENSIKRTNLAVNEGMLSYRDLIILVRRYGQCSFFTLWSNNRGVVGINRRNIDDDIRKKDISQLKKFLNTYKDNIPENLSEIDVVGVYKAYIKRKKSADNR